MLQGDYDPRTFVETNTATYPQPAPPAVLYQPGMWWNATADGTMSGQAVHTGDRIYVIGRGRPYGDFTYGDLVYGNPPDRDWNAALVAFTIWDSTRPPTELDPFPYSGCAFTQDEHPFGNWAPGWRIIIDAFYNPNEHARTYGSISYGDEVYGDAEGEGAPGWYDITKPAYSILAVDGTRDGRDQVDVAEVVIDLYDDDGAWFDFPTPTFWFRPQVGDAIRVGLMSPIHRYYPLVVGAIEQIDDVHDVKPRQVTVQAFGHIMDLNVDVVAWQRPAETASARFAALVAQAGWRFGTPSLVYPPDDGPLLADIEPMDISCRSEIDRTVNSVGWFMDTDPYGNLRLRHWPHEPTGTQLHVVDCEEDSDDPAALLSGRIDFVSDQSQLLNRVQMTNTADPRVQVQGEAAMSIARYGRKGKAMGFPRDGLAFADTNQTLDVCYRIVSRFGHIVHHIASVTADTALDEAWLLALAAMDTGQSIRVERTAIYPYTLDGVVVGWEHRITPGRFISSLFLSTITPTF